MDPTFYAYEGLNNCQIEDLRALFSRIAGIRGRRSAVLHLGLV